MASIYSWALYCGEDGYAKGLGPFSFDESTLYSIVAWCVAANMEIKLAQSHTSDTTTSLIILQVANWLLFSFDMSSQQLVSLSVLLSDTCTVLFPVSSSLMKQQPQHVESPCIDDTRQNHHVDLRSISREELAALMDVGDMKNLTEIYTAINTIRIRFESTRSSPTTKNRRVKSVKLSCINVTPPAPLIARLSGVEDGIRHWQFDSLRLGLSWQAVVSNWGACNAQTPSREVMDDSYIAHYFNRGVDVFFNKHHVVTRLVLHMNLLDSRNQTFGVYAKCMFALQGQAVTSNSTTDELIQVLGNTYDKKVCDKEGVVIMTFPSLPGLSFFMMTDTKQMLAVELTSL